MLPSTDFSLKVFITVALLFAISVAPAFCQDTSNSVMAGPNPYGEYHGGDIDSVSLFGGGLHLHIPIFSDHSQRGKLNFTYSVVSSTSSWQLVAPIRNYGPWTIQPVNNAVGRMAPKLVTDGTVVRGYTTVQDNNGNKKRLWYVQDSDGAVHHLGNITCSGTSCTYPLYLESVDGTGIRATILDSSLNNIIVRRDGVQFINTSAVPTIEDPNGNQLSTTYNLSTGVTTTVDTLGRTWSQAPTTDFSHCPVAASYPMTWTIPGPNAGVSVFKFCKSTINIQTNFANVPSNTSQYSATVNFITGIVLPNLTFWRLDYNDYGDVVKVTLPTGGTISYQYSYDIYGCGGSSGSVTSRTASDGTNSATWNYNTSTGATVTDPLGNDIVVTKYADCSDLPKQIKYYSGPLANGNLLKTVDKTYMSINDPFLNTLNSSAPNPALPITTTTTWPNGQVAQEQHSYDAGFPFYDYINYGFYCPSGCRSVYGLVVTENHYDYGNGAPGALLATKNTNYVALSNSTYATANILELPSSVITLNGSGYKCAETDYAYDDSARLFSSGVTEQHVAAPNSVRGNLSSTTRQVTSTPCQASATWTASTSYNNVYDTGMLYQAIDPLAHTTTLAYSPTYYGAYPTTITNALNQSTTQAYDFNTGLLTSTTDPNGLSTTFGYDNMRRLSQSNHPDGGLAIVTYQETAYPFKTTVSTPINSSQNKTTVTVFDGLGRPTQTQLTSDPQGTVYKDTTYDSVGRVATVSNPYRKGTDITTTTGTTTYGYDALGRKTSETYPDNSVLTTAYCGSSTLVTDPTGKWRRSRADGLGRLVEVDEPNAIGATVASTGCPGTGEPIWVTSYVYDPLNNLTSVLQNNSHSRSFTYDSLSHLLTANNPETGQISYAYNNDGVLISKTDARGITTNYNPSANPIDALHRITGITYSNSDPSVTYAYDQANCLGLSTCQNIGHRTSITDAAGSEVWSYHVDNTNSDTTKRTVHVDQRTTGGITKTSTYYLDQAGNLAHITYPAGRIVNYTYDNANRPSTAIDGSNGITYATGFKTSPGTSCLSNVTCYTPQGTFYALSIGETASFTGLNLTHIYNSRLQPSEFKASSAGGNAIDISYNFVDPVSGKNAGHVYGITNNLDTTRSQNFTYDQLNRISSAFTTSTHATSPAHCWGETYGLDAWGNLQSIAQTTNSNYTGCTQESGFSAPADGNNHLNGFSYDSSGNTQSDGTISYTWDAESQLKSATNGGTTTITSKTCSALPAS